MNKMIERVARAIAKADATVKGQFDDTEMGDIFWDEWKHLYIPMARAAIEAMREPTIPMIIAGRAASNTDELIDGSSDETFLNADKVFIAMIDAALKETA